ncbi:hypothetical protein [Oceanirhabdus seepicola]|uniref:Uncharacterized protein n=1 Tax=Oceanirhabdus seepicola TaxID=2828781 RepID=A0A9J6P5M8_9CLOT|nr:hypothetical protein [Oceanirhabdus seepicola]MCM1991430.1 hypothetical protein [Oceanirhabdus seepicola]
MEETKNIEVDKTSYSYAYHAETEAPEATMNQKKNEESDFAKKIYRALLCCSLILPIIFTAGIVGVGFISLGGATIFCGASAILFVGASIYAFASSIGYFATEAFTGVGLIGSSMLALAISLLCLIATIFIVRCAFPGFNYQLRAIYEWIVDKKEGAK